MSAGPTSTARVVRGAAGLAAVAVGVFLALRPLTTLQVTVWAAAAALVVWAAVLVRGARGRAWPWLAAAGLAAAAVALVVFTPEVVRAYPVLLAAALALNGVRLLVRALRPDRATTPKASRAGAVTDRITDGVLAAANIAAAVLVWLWPDVGLLLLAWVVAAAVAVTGLRLVWRALRDPRPGVVNHSIARAARRCVAPGGSRGLYSRQRWPSRHPSALPGCSRGSPRSTTFTPGRARCRPSPESCCGSPRTTVRRRPAPRACASSTPRRAPTAQPRSRAPWSRCPPPRRRVGGRTLLAWQHGTTGVARSCAPSLRANALSEHAIPGISRMIDRGWAIVATDYPGMGTAGRYPYLIGVGEGQATLDGLRALCQVDDAHASNRVMLWGHSQGGHATLWAAQIAADYAPDLDVVGVAALSSATDPLAVSKLIIEGPASALVNAVTSYVVVPYADEYPDLTLIGPTHPAGSVFADAAASRCATDPGTLVTLLVTLGLGGRDHLYDLDLDAGPVHDRLAQNIATAIVPAPLFLGQGVDDEVVSIDIQRTTDARVCAAGRPVETHEYPGRDHLGVIAQGSPLIDDLFV